MFFLILSGLRAAELFFTFFVSFFVKHHNRKKHKGIKQDDGLILQDEAPPQEKGHQKAFDWRFLLKRPSAG